jgi:hypothetical protein
LIQKIKVFEDINGVPYFIKNAHAGSRVVPMEQILISSQKRVRDGSGGRYYNSGFHVFSDDSLINEWRSILKIVENRFVCQVLVDGLSPKPHSKYKMWLAEKIVLPFIFWDQKIPLEEVIKK